MCLVSKVKCNSSSAWFCYIIVRPFIILLSTNSDGVFILVYVDDIIITDNNTTFIQQIILFLDQTFTIKDLRQLHFILGIEVHNSQHGSTLTQAKYIYSILDRAKMTGAKSISTPMATTPALTKSDRESMLDPHLYRSIVGALQYATITRPDIAFCSE
jgi:Reverse transcriptase (RNA-dependent DNA polymerase)